MFHIIYLYYTIPQHNGERTPTTLQASAHVLQFAVIECVLVEYALFLICLLVLPSSIISNVSVFSSFSCFVVHVHT